MPQVSRFYGISIYLYYRDHAPPHFHAIYGEHEAVFGIESGSVVEGQLPRRAERLVRDWIKQHRDALRGAWEQARANEVLAPIPPLE